MLRDSQVGGKLERAIAMAKCIVIFNKHFILRIDKQCPKLRIFLMHTSGALFPKPCTRPNICASFLMIILNVNKAIV